MKRTLGEAKLRRRSLALVVFMATWIVIVMGRMACLQIVQHESLLARANGQHRRTIRIGPLRGVIHDRLGRELARSVEAESVYAVPAEVDASVEKAAHLARALGLKRADVVDKLTGSREFVWIKRKVSSEEAAAVRALQLSGIYFVSENKRQYPNDQLAAHVLGHVGIDEVGLDGVELTYDDHLRGQEGYVLVERDARGRLYGRTQLPVYKGQDLTLTVDAAIQMELEGSLQEAVDNSGATSGVGIVMRPQTGEILALANVPTFDPNQFTITSEEQRRNRAVRDLYEPGSVFKIVTYAAALEKEMVDPDDTIDCLGGQINVTGQTIRDHKVFHALSIREALENSSNVAAIRLALGVGPDQFVEVMKAFGFFRPTGVDLSGEAPGMMPSRDKWSMSSLGAAAIGQGVGVTGLQMLAAINVIANNGLWVQPHLIRSVHARSGELLAETKPDGRRVISPRTAKILAEMLAGVVLRGTGKRARLDGYTCAGKTGTAQQFDPRTGRYSTTRYVASFAGFAPARNPQVSILVAIDHPRGEYHGGVVAAPPFRRIAEMALHYLGVPPDAVNNRVQMVAIDGGFTSEETRGFPLEDGETRAGVNHNILQQNERKGESGINPDDGTGKIIYQFTTGGNQPLDDAAPLTMPSFEGQGIRSVAEYCDRLGIRLVAVGTGKAVGQTPEPGAPVTPGQACRVEFRR